MTKLNFKDLEDAEERFVLDNCVGSGVFAEVYKASDTSNGDRRVAIKIQKFLKENEGVIAEELKVLRDYSTHVNLPDFYGGFKKTRNDVTEIWFVMELCEGGPIIDLVNGLLEKNRRMSEEHISFILKEVVKGLVYLHQNHIIHRDIRASNILLTSEGDVKLVDFGLSHQLSSTLGRTDTCLGSPCWMAPEVVTSTGDINDEGYGSRADVWATGITAIELGDGKTPFSDMHPTRAMFQIVRNPPPTLYRPRNWSDIYNDFISECLTKNPEHRPFMEELMEHPFLSAVPENNYHLSQELKSLIQNLNDVQKNFDTNKDFIKSNFLKSAIDQQPERMLVEDLAALDRLNEDTILQELESRMQIGQFQTFVGDILLILNPNESKNIYGTEYHRKYSSKSRSDNAPHIYAVADSAYQEALHHLVPQNIVLGGESNSGKTTNYTHILDHLLFLGESMNINTNRIMNGAKLLQLFIQATTPCNTYSTRCVMKTEVVYGRSGKVSGCVFGIYQLEKLRISSTDMNQSNFHSLYYIYDGLSKSGDLGKYKLDEGRKYRYLRIPETLDTKGPRNDIEENIKKFQQIDDIFNEYEFTPEQIETIYSIVAAILLIGDVKFKSDGGSAAVENEQCINEVATLLGVDDKKLRWSLTNYCLVSHGTASRKQLTCDEARSARDTLANTLYGRMVDYIVNVVNHKLSYGRAIFGEKYSVRIFDLFGFECFKQNGFSQLIVNTMNEQLHYLYTQRVFAWEALEMNEENIPFTPIHYYDNKSALDEILSKGELLTVIDETSKNDLSSQYIVDHLLSKDTQHVKANDKEFTIAHYTGKVNYDASDIPDRNRNFLPPEVIDVCRSSSNPIIKLFFVNKLSKTGNINVSFDEKPIKAKTKPSSSSSEDENAYSGKYSQIKKMRTVAGTFRSLCLDILKELAVGVGAGNTHFVRCVRSDLDSKPRGFHTDIVRQQIRAMAIVETAKIRQKGYSHRIIFSEFLRRYKFLAFDFDENVETTRDNCRLLMVRLKMEGWLIGTTKVFLKYYNEEYLSRLYETQVQKIIKIQCMLRGFLVKRKLAKRIRKCKENIVTEQRHMSQDVSMTEDEAARIIQKAYRGLPVRNMHSALVSNETDELDENTRDFIKPYSEKWKSKSLFQVLLQYRAARHHDLFNMSQQVHFFNQKIVHNLEAINYGVALNHIEPKAQASAWLSEMKLPILKLPFRLDDVPYFDTSYMCEPVTNVGTATENEESWDSPFLWRQRDTVSSQMTNSLLSNEDYLLSKPFAHHIKEESNTPPPNKSVNDSIINMPYIRDPSQPISVLSSSIIVSEEWVPNTTKQCVSRPPSRRGSIIKSVDSPKSECKYQETSRRSSLVRSPSQNITTNQRIFQKNEAEDKSTSPIVHKELKNKENVLAKTMEDEFNSSYKMGQINTVAELQKMARRFSSSEDDPPFNFQGMLRKTNYQRESLKRTVSNICLIRRQSRDIIDSHDQVNSSFKSAGNVSKRDSLKKRNSIEVMKSHMISTEVAPGIFMEGYVADL